MRAETRAHCGSAAGGVLKRVVFGAPQLYASKFGVSPEKMCERLWGENFFDSATKMWTKKVRCQPFWIC
jgi:hypothetical protein